MDKRTDRRKIICFYWQGDRWNKDLLASDEPHLKRAGVTDSELASKYINNLYQGVKKFADREFDFICFSNEDVKVDKGIQVKEFPVLSRGVLPRLWMFSEETGLFGHQVLCLDLDVLIVGSLNHILDYDGLFCTRPRFMPGEGHKLDGDIMSFYACSENERRFWTPLTHSLKFVENLTNGRERFWVSHVTRDKADRWDKVAPGQVVSYKMHVKRNGLSKDNRIVSFHGYPRPHQANEEWIKQYWK